MRPKEAFLKALEIMSMSALSTPHPSFRVWDRLPKHLRESISELKSDDISKDNWHLRQRDEQNKKSQQGYDAGATRK